MKNEIQSVDAAQMTTEKAGAAVSQTEATAKVKVGAKKTTLQLEKKAKLAEDKLNPPPEVGRISIMLESHKPRELTRCEICRLLCGHENKGVAVLVLAIGAAAFFTFSRYKNPFSRDGIWIFFVLGMLACLLTVSFMVRVCIVIQRKKAVGENAAHDENQKAEKSTSKIAVMFRPVIAMYNDCTDVNGKYYLTKMYASEAVEHIQQVYSLTTIYLCSMPVGGSSIVSSVLTIELLTNIWVTFHFESQESRDRLILMDIFTDIFCLAFPLLYSYSLGMLIPFESMRAIIVYPMLSLLSKLNDIWEDYFAMDLQRVEKRHRKNTETFKKRGSRKRKSVLNLAHNRDVMEMQLDHFPKWLRYAFTILNISFILFFVSLILVHLTTQPSTDTCNNIFTKEVWGGCQVEVPFCQDLYVAKCDCAMLKITNYTKIKLPESFGKLKSLGKIGIYTGQLEELPDLIGDNHERLMVLHATENKLKLLPDSIGKLRNLIELSVFNNRIQSLPETLGNLRHLIALYVFNNRIQSLPETLGNLRHLIRLYVFNNRLKSLPDSVGTLQNLRVFYAFNNQLQVLPDSVRTLQSLQYLSVFNNNLVSLPDTIGQLRNLEYLWVFNNQLKSLPDSVGNLQKLLLFFAWNNTLRTLPKTVGNMKSLSQVDLRHNDLTYLPSTAGKWSNVEYLYLAGNPLCRNSNIPTVLKKAQGLCEQQCSEGCPSDLLGRYGCDDDDHTYHIIVSDLNYPTEIQPKPNSGCNTEVCEYDKGECLHQ